VSAEVAERRVTVFGGSGFLGRRIALRLAAAGA
jgi:nucleoside-diphosphate-sugar epimerase